MTAAAPEREARRSDRAWSPYRRALGPLASVVDEARTQALHLEDLWGMRKRARRQADLHTFTLSIEALISDLTHRVLTAGPLGRIHISLDNRDLRACPRYRPAAVGVPVTQALMLLSAVEVGPWLIVRKTHTIGERTTIEAGPRLLERIRECGVTLSDLCTDTQREEVIIQRGKPNGDAPERGDRWFRATEFVNYPDTPGTNAMREEVRAINSAVQRLTVEVTSEDGSQIAPADMKSLHLRRIFTGGSFDHGGRLWDASGGAFWYSMRNRSVPLKRIQRLTINGEPVASVDMHAAALSCLYAMAGVCLPEGDLYVPPGFSKEHRRDFKKAAQCMIFRQRRHLAWPAQEPGTLPAQEVFAAMEDLHAPVRHLMWRGVGHRTQRMESDTLVRALVRNPRLCGLPLHDALIVPESRAEDAQEALEAAFREVTGGTCRVTVEFAS